MKTVLFTCGFFEYVIELANSLSKIQEVVLIMPKNHVKKSHIKSISSNIKCDFFYLPRQINPRCLLTMQEVKAKIDSHNPDVVHLQSHGHLWFFSIFSKISKYAIVNTVHDPKPHLGEEKFYHNFIIKNGLKNTDMFIVHGHYLKNQMERFYNIDNRKISVIPHGNFELYKKGVTDFPKKGEKKILFFGRLWKYKGLQYLIKAEPLISQKIKDYKIVLAFHGESFSKYSKLIMNWEKFEIHNRYIPNEEVSNFFDEASVVVLPYVEASQSGVVAISFAFGKPVVVTNVGSLSEVVDHGNTGFVVSPKSVSELANAIIKLLSDDNLREIMGQKALKFSKTELSWDEIAKTTNKTYMDCIMQKEKGKLE